MPIYEFECQQCGKVASVLVRRPDAEADKKRQCEGCGSADLVKLMSRPAMIKSAGSASGGELRHVDPRKAVENVSRQYDRSGIDPGRGFEEVANRAAATAACP